MSELYDAELDDEIWLEVLGPLPEEGGFTSFDIGAPSTWPRADDAPPDGIFYFRWISAHLHMDPTIKGARALRANMRRWFKSGELKAVALNSETGTLHVMRPETWMASSQAGRRRWWSGLYWSAPNAEDRCDVYLVGDPVPLAALKKAPAAALTPKAENMLALLYYTQVLKSLGRKAKNLDHGIFAQLARDYEKLGVAVSPDTIAKWLRRGSDEYDAKADPPAEA